MRACNVDVDKLRERVGAFIDEDLRGLVVSVAQDAKPTLSFQRAVQRALFHVQSSGREEVTGANVLVAIFSERESHAVHFLQGQDMTRLRSEQRRVGQGCVRQCRSGGSPYP